MNDFDKEERKRDLIEAAAAIGLTFLVLFAIIGGLAVFCG
jgi:hypothetical protein